MRKGAYMSSALCGIKNRQNQAKCVNKDIFKLIGNIRIDEGQRKQV